MRWYHVVRTTKEVQTISERAPHCYIIRMVIVLLSVKVGDAVLEVCKAVVLTRIRTCFLLALGRIGKVIRGEELRSHRQAVSARFRNAGCEALNALPIQEMWLKQV